MNKFALILHFPSWQIATEVRAHSDHRTMKHILLTPERVPQNKCLQYSLYSIWTGSIIAWRPRTQSFAAIFFLFTCQHAGHCQKSLTYVKKSIVSRLSFSCPVKKRETSIQSVFSLKKKSPRNCLQSSLRANIKCLSATFILFSGQNYMYIMTIFFLPTGSPELLLLISTR